MGDLFLFEPIQLRKLVLRNRVVISPMSQHMATNGVANDWHLVHVGQFALGGAGLVLMESTAVSPQGMSGDDDLGLWNDAQEESLSRIAAFARSQGAALGIQLSHAGRKAGKQALWKGDRPLTTEEMHRVSPEWQRVAPSAVAIGGEWSTPASLTKDGVRSVVAAFASAAERADRAGLDVLELHFAHGYLVAQFLSATTNLRDDEYGGSLDNRLRLAVEITDAVRARWPQEKPLFCRISAVDGAGDESWSLNDSVVLAKALKAHGVDVIDCSSGGIAQSPTAAARGLGFQVPYASRIRREAQIPVQAVGFIVEPLQAEAILRNGDADLIAIGRQALFEPYWAHHARQALTEDPMFSQWPAPYRVWLQKRAPVLAAAKETQRQTQAQTI